MGASAWKTSLSIYAYLPTIGGSTTFPTLPGNPSPGVNIDANTIIDHLKMTFMGALDIHNGKWGAFTDILYMDIGGNKPKSRDFTIDGVPGALTGDMSLDIKGTIWTTALTRLGALARSRGQSRGGVRRISVIVHRISV